MKTILEKRLVEPTERQAVHLARLYWAIRFGMAFIWIWTAIACWFFYPHAESLAWLHRLGVTKYASALFVGACFIDLGLGVASCLFSSKKLWLIQCIVVIGYSSIIAIGLPEFLIHPFGPITKNIAVLGCLTYLFIMENNR